MENMPNYSGEDMFHGRGGFNRYKGGVQRGLPIRKITCHACKIRLGRGKTYSPLIHERDIKFRQQHLLSYAADNIYHHPNIDTNFVSRGTACFRRKLFSHTDGRIRLSSHAGSGYLRNDRQAAPSAAEYPLRAISFAAERHTSVLGSIFTPFFCIGGQYAARHAPAEIIMKYFNIC